MEQGQEASHSTHFLQATTDQSQDEVVLKQIHCPHGDNKKEL